MWAGEIGSPHNFGHSVLGTPAWICSRGRKGMRLLSSGQVFRVNWEAPDAVSGRRENRVAQRLGNRRQSEFTRPGGDLFAGSAMHVHNCPFVNADALVVVQDL